MSFLDCINSKVREGFLTPKQARSVKIKYNELFLLYKETMGDIEAGSTAAAKVAEVEEKQLLARIRNTKSAAIHQIETVKKLESLKGNKKIDTPYNVLMQKAADRGTAYVDRTLSIMGDFVEKHRAKFAGLKVEREGLFDIYRVLAGEVPQDGNMLRMGRAVKEGLDYIYKEYESAGGIIGKLENYFPQFHDHKLVKGVSFDEWYSAIRPRIDSSKMSDIDTGLPFTERRLRDVSEAVYESIVTNGRSKLTPKVLEGKQMTRISRELSERKGSSRFFHFKSADDFFEYNKQFGSGDEGLYDALINHVRGMGRDVGILKTMGAKPRAFNRHMQLRMQSTLGDVPVARQKNSQAIFEVLAGDVDMSASDSVLFNALSNMQRLFASAVLGAASLSAIGDTTFVALTAKINGLSQTKTMGRYLKALNPADSSERQLIKNMGFIADNANATAFSEAKWAGEVNANKLMSAFSNFTMRSSGLHAMTQAAKNAPALELMSMLGAHQQKAWKDLDPAFREAASLFDINEKDWANIQKTDAFSPREGTAFIKASDIADEKTSLKVEDWIQQLRRMASNEPGLQTRAITTGAILGDARNGTLLRGIANSTFMFKGFGITVLLNHMLPAIRKSSQGKFHDLAYIALGTTVMGALSLQLKSLATGKDTRDMEDWKFWQAAAMQGGGFGLYGDFLFADYNRFGQDPFTSAMGFVPQLGSNVTKAIKGNLDKTVDNKDTNFLRDTLRIGKGFVPAQSLWYSRLVVERSLFDQLEKMVDPKYHQRRRQHERKIKKDYGQQYWWRKGELKP